MRLVKVAAMGPTVARIVVSAGGSWESGSARVVATIVGSWGWCWRYRQVDEVCITSVSWSRVFTGAASVGWVIIWLIEVG